MSATVLPSLLLRCPALLPLLSPGRFCHEISEQPIIYTQVHHLFLVRCRRTKSRAGAMSRQNVRSVAMTSLTIQVGAKLFSFPTFSSWVNRANVIWKQHRVPPSQTICIDQKGRICTIGKQFMAADRENAFPVDVYAIEQVGSDETVSDN